MKLCHNSLLAIGIIVIGIVESVALLTGHNGNFFNLAMGAMVALAGGAPALNARFLPKVEDPAK